MKLEDEYRLRAECAERKLAEDNADFQQLCVDVRALEEALRQEHAGPSTGRVVSRWLRLKFWRAVQRRRRTNISVSRPTLPSPEQYTPAQTNGGATPNELTAEGYERMIHCAAYLRMIHSGDVA